MTNNLITFESIVNLLLVLSIYDGITSRKQAAHLTARRVSVNTYICSKVLHWKQRISHQRTYL